MRQPSATRGDLRLEAILLDQIFKLVDVQLDVRLHWHRVAYLRVMGGIAEAYRILKTDAFLLGRSGDGPEQWQQILCGSAVILRQWSGVPIARK